MQGDTYPVNSPAGAGEPGLWCTGEEALRITSFSGDGNAQVTLGIRFQEHDRLTPVAYQERHVPNTDRTAATSDYPLGEGWLKSVTAVASSGAPVYAHTFIRLDIIRSRGGVATVLHTLMQGPVSALTRRTWPGSPLQASIEGPGTIRSITGTNPAAGAEISETVPTGARWMLLSIRADLVTDGTAATRTPQLILDDGTTSLWVADPVGATSASLTRGFNAGAGADRPSSTLTELTWAIPYPMPLLAGFRIRTLTNNIVAGDNWGAPQLLVEEHLEAA